MSLLLQRYTVYALSGAIPSIQEYPIEKRNDINLILKNIKKEIST